jgi:hypothetical protein
VKRFRFSPRFKKRFQIRQSENDDRDPVVLCFHPINQLLKRLGVVLSKLRCDLLQAFFRVRALGRRKSLHPVEVVMSNPNQDQIWKSLLAQDLKRLSREIARPDDPSANAFARSGRSNERPGTIVFRSNEWRESLQPFVHTPNARWIRVGIEKPVLAPLGPCSPKQADRRRYVNVA